MSSEIKYMAAAYSRASKDDINSDTIENQIDMIHNHIKSMPDICIISVRKDKGYSGVNFLRPHFEKMMEDIKAGKINCVIVKDLSRLGRNYLEVGELIDIIFPLYNVRLIAVNDNYDSIRPRNDLDDILLPIKNLINEYALRDSSKKIRSSLDNKRMNGEFVNAFAPYGYKRDENNKHRLVIDDYAETVVRNIFRMKIEGLSMQKIAVMLNEAGELSPADYKERATNYKSTFKKKERASWTAASVRRILANPVYTGVLIQGRHTTPNYKVKKKIARPESDWHVILDSHEPIISQLEFEILSGLLKQDNRAANNANDIYPLSGFVYCADCGDSMIRQRSQKWVYLVCASSRKKGGCTSHCIQVQKLESAVLEFIKQQIKLSINIEESSEIARILSSKKKIDEANLNTQLIDRKNEIKSCEIFRSSLYEDYKREIISKEDFVKFGKYYKDRITQLTAAVEKLREDAGLLMSKDSPYMQWLQHITGFENVSKLNRYIVVVLIERIEVFSGKRILIKLRYQDKPVTVQGMPGSLIAGRAGAEDA